MTDFNSSEDGSSGPSFLPLVFIYLENKSFRSIPQLPKYQSELALLPAGSIGKRSRPCAVSIREDLPAQPCPSIGQQAPRKPLLAG